MPASGVIESQSQEKSPRTELHPYETQVIQIEIAIVFSVACCLLVTIMFVSCWILFGVFHDIVLRLKQAMVSLDEHWKAGALLFITLFYRPVRIFFSRVQSFMGMQAGEAEGELNPKLRPKPKK